MGENELDRALVERVQNGDRRAFDLLVRKYQHKVIGLISRYVSDSQRVRGRGAGGLRAGLAGDRLVPRRQRVLHLDVQDRRQHRQEPPGGDAVGARRPTTSRSRMRVYGPAAERLHDNATPEREMMREEMEQTVFPHCPSIARRAAHRHHPAGSGRVSATRRSPRPWTARSAPCVPASSGRARRSTGNCVRCFPIARNRDMNEAHRENLSATSFPTVELASSIEVALPAAPRSSTTPSCAIPGPATTWAVRACAAIPPLASAGFAERVMQALEQETAAPRAGRPRPLRMPRRAWLRWSAGGAIAAGVARGPLTLVQPAGRRHGAQVSRASPPTRQQRAVAAASAAAPATPAAVAAVAEQPASPRVYSQQAAAPWAAAYASGRRIAGACRPIACRRCAHRTSAAAICCWVDPR